MSSEIIKSVLSGAQVTVSPDQWPLRRKVHSIRVSMTKWTWNGLVTLNRVIPVEANREFLGEVVNGTIREMAETIETPDNWKG